MSIFEYERPRRSVFEDFGDWMREEMFHFHTKRAITNPKAQATISGITDRPMIPIGPEIKESDWVPDGDKVYKVAAMPDLGVRAMVLFPKYNQYGERTGIQALKKTPFYSRHDLGIREAARARRRARRGLR